MVITRILRFAVVISCFQLWSVASAQAGCATPECLQATAWHRGFTAVVLKSDVNPSQQYSIEQSIRAAGGRIALIGRQVFVGWIAPGAIAQLRRMEGIETVTQAPVSVASLALSGSQHDLRNARRLLGFYNDVVTGREADRVGKALPEFVGPPLVNDVSPGGSALAKQTILSIDPSSVESTSGKKRGTTLKITPQLAHSPRRPPRSWPHLLGLRRVHRRL
jgi:hypothetical protein